MGFWVLIIFPSIPKALGQPQEAYKLVKNHGGDVCEVHAVKLMNLSPENGSFLFDQAASEIGSKQPISRGGDVSLRAQSGPLPVVNGVITLIDLGLEPHSPILLRQFMRDPCHAI